MTEQQMKQRFDELVPWHVNGTLDTWRREWIEHYLRAHPQARAELRWHESLQAVIRESEAGLSSDLGLERLMARIRAESRATQRAKTATLSQRISGLAALLRMTPALAVAAAVIMAQAGVIGVLVMQQEGRDALPGGLSAERSIDRVQLISGPVLQVNFKSDATERDIRSLLVSVSGTLVGGPGQLGNYIVLVPADKVNQAAQQLAASKLVQEVSVLPDPPTRE